MRIAHRWLACTTTLLSLYALAPPAVADADRRLAVFGYTRTVPVESMPDSVIDDWKYLDDRNVLAFRRGQPFLLALNRDCPALQTAGVIGFNAAISGLVATQSLLVGSGSVAAECGIEQIVQLEKRAAAPRADQGRLFTP